VLRPSRQQVLVGATPMGRHPEGGIAHRLIRYAWPGMSVLDDLMYGLPEAGVDDLVFSPSGRLLLTYLNSGQGQNGYELFGLDGPLRRLGAGEIFTLEAMCCPPVFSPGERLVACAPGPRAVIRFWTPGEEDWPPDDGRARDELEVPGTGGIVTFGSLVLHDIAANAVSTHLLRFDLPPGWAPNDPEDDMWAWGANEIEFPADDLVRLLLPGGQRAELRLPLSAAVLLPAPGRACGIAAASAAGPPACRASSGSHEAACPAAGLRPLFLPGAGQGLGPGLPRLRRAAKWRCGAYRFRHVAVTNDARTCSPACRKALSRVTPAAAKRDTSRPGHHLLVTISYVPVASLEILLKEAKNVAVVRKLD
jgi:hypothetical protein